MTVDHECHNADPSCAGGPSCLHRRCVNPAHLALKTTRWNTFASPNTAAARNRAKTKCPAGHDYDEVNTWVDRHGHRRCRICLSRRQREARERRVQRLADLQVSA